VNRFGHRKPVLTSVRDGSLASADDQSESRMVPHVAMFWNWHTRQAAILRTSDL
jgi:hypothetical protein